MSEILDGLGVSAGVAVGRVLLLPAQVLPVVPTPVPPERVEQEVARFDRARESARVELTALRDRVRASLGEHYATIIEAQLMILDDARLLSETGRRIRVGRVSAEWALKEVIADVMRAFEVAEDEYLRERGGDLDDVHRRIQRQLRGGHSLRGGKWPEGPLVVVAHTLGPADAMALAEHNVLGLATDVGGPTAHATILAQALSVPAVVGLRDVSLRVHSGEPIILDGDSGRVELRPDPGSVDSARVRQDAWRAREKAMVSDRGLPAVTTDGAKVTIRANIEFAHEVDAALRYGAEGVGLYRSEFLYLAHSPKLPTEQEHYETYREIGERVSPHPAVIRTLDLGGEKYFHTVLDRTESNPVLGLRAIRFCLKRPDVFRPQLRGILRAAAHADLKLMIPLVTTPEEVREVRRLLHQEAETLKGEGQAVRADVELGIMIEVPAAAIAADLLAREADFFSVGTNDLIQYALAVDRGNESVNYLYQPEHPAVLRMIRFVIESARSEGIPVSMCGEMAADPSMTGLLLGLGLRELSVQPRAISSVRRAVRDTEVKVANLAAERDLRRAGGTTEHGSKDRVVLEKEDG